MVKLLCSWGVFSLLLLVWDGFFAPLFGFFVDDFFRGYLCVTIAIFCFALAYRFGIRKIDCRGKEVHYEAVVEKSISYH